MEKRLYFCADLGTSSLKAALIDNAGCPHGFARVYYKNSESATTWLDAFLQAAEQIAASFDPPSAALAPSSATLAPVSAVCISGSGPTLVPVTGDNPQTAESLRSVYWYDPVPPNVKYEGITSLFLPKVQSFITIHAEKIQKIKWFLSSQEWLSWKLGARPVTVLPHDGYIPYYWDNEQCGRLGIHPEWFTPFETMGKTIGELNPIVFGKDSVAATLFAPGTPIIAGAADFIMALVGTGTLKPGTACDRTGSSEGINFCATAIPELHSGGLRVLPHAVPGLFNIGAIIPQSGILFDQYRSSSGQEDKDYHELTKEIFADPDHPGKKVLTTIGSSFVKALDDVQNAGCDIKELVLSGGQCADPLWNNYKATISGRTLQVPEIIHAELAGNAVLCEAAFSGESLQETAAKMIRIKDVFLPLEEVISDQGSVK